MELIIKDGDLVCPNCGYPHLHQRLVKTYCRLKEDSGVVGVTEVGQSSTGERRGSEGDLAPFFVLTFDNETAADNPSARRDGLTVEFECECCDARPLLGVSQHKGATQVRWLRT